MSRPTQVDGQHHNGGYHMTSARDSITEFTREDDDRGFAHWRFRAAVGTDDSLYEGKCADRNGLLREEHSPDKDGRCVFCDKAVAD